MRRIIIDTDTGSDDAIAIVLALRTKEIKVEAITTVAGNVPIDLATRNALISIDMAETYVPPVYEGCSVPLCRPQITAQQVHGQDGLGDVGYERPDIPVEKEHAVDAIARLVDQFDDLEIITLGPLTNIAMAIRMYPETMKKVKKITAMGGEYRCMNPHTPTAEFNILVDPDAAEVVLGSGIFTEFVPLDVCLGDCAFTKDEIDKLAAIGTRQAKFFVDCNKTLIDYMEKKHGKPMLTMPDPTAVAYFIDPTLATERIEAYTRCETKSELTVGELVYDYLDLLGQPKNAAVIPDMDAARFKQMIFDCCR